MEVQSLDALYFVAHPNAHPAKDASVQLKLDDRVGLDAGFVAAVYLETVVVQLHLVGVVLQRTNAGFVADRAVQRMLDKQHFKTGVVETISFLGSNGNFNALFNRLGTRVDQLFFPADFYFHHAGPACGKGFQIPVGTKVGDGYAVTFGGIQDHRTLFGGNGLSVDFKMDNLGGHAGIASLASAESSSL
jgi:hypothetical protein